MERISERGLTGRIKIRQWPNWLDPESETEFLKWRPTISAREWDRYTVPLLVEGKEVEEAHNLITNLGITTILGNMGNSTQSFLNVFSQILSVGNGALTGVLRTDTAVAGDGFATNSRRQPSSLIITGLLADTGINFLSGDANGTWTNVGYYGWKLSNSTNATTTAGTGQLNSHSMFLFTKGAGPLTVDYLYLLGN